jgi:hypothetical protein
MNAPSMINSVLAPVHFTTVYSPVSSPPPLSTNIAILDSGSSAHYLTATAAQNLTTAPTLPISIVLPDGSLLSSQETMLLPLPPNNLPILATTAHVVPNLSPHSLLSIGQYCDAGCTATLTATTATISHGSSIILTGQRDPMTWLWHIPLGNIHSAAAPSTHQCHAINARTSLADRIAYYLACCFSPALSTWCTAIDAGRFTSWPELTSALVRKYPPTATAMHKGHLDQSRANQQSTQLSTVSTSTAPNATLLKESTSEIAPPLSDPPALRTNYIFADCQPIT